MHHNGISLECPKLDRPVPCTRMSFQGSSGWTLLACTPRSMVWFLRGALCSERLLKSLEDAGTWCSVPHTAQRGRYLLGKGVAVRMCTETAGALGLKLESFAGHSSPYLQGSCTISVALECRRGSADICELEPLRR